MLKMWINLKKHDNRNLPSSGIKFFEEPLQEGNNLDKQHFAMVSSHINICPWLYGICPHLMHIEHVIVMQIWHW